jgi:3-methyladenine DNA glycosylase/8-oxoguanine DNA glycosylase
MPFLRVMLRCCTEQPMVKVKGSLKKMIERLQPWRAYAAQHLWAADAAAIVHG